MKSTINILIVVTQNGTTDHGTQNGTTDHGIDNAHTIQDLLNEIQEKNRSFKDTLRTIVREGLLH